jgi:hypothetical protein
MEINKAKLASGDRGELLKLARSIKASEPRDRNVNPLASQFFDSEPAGVRPLDTDTLLASLGGADFNEHISWIEALSAAGYDERMKLLRPDKTADVARIGCGSGWTPPASVTVSTKAGTFTGPARFRKSATAMEPNTAHAGLLAETLKSILFQLLGADVLAFDPSTLKARISTALKVARPDLRERLAKALAA